MVMKPKNSYKRLKVYYIWYTLCRYMFRWSSQGTCITKEVL